MNFHLKSSVARQGIFLCTLKGKRFTDPSAYRRLKEKIKMIIQNRNSRFMQGDRSLGVVEKKKCGALRKTAFQERLY